MKKTTRLLAFLLVIALCLPLTGCKALEDMRSHQAYRQENGSILWNGTEYKPIETRDITLNLTQDLTQDDEIEEIHVTKSDVPVLLSGMFGTIFGSYNDGLFIGEYYSSVGIYCRADQYDAVLERIAIGFTPDKICYDYYLYDKNDFYIGDAQYVLTAQQKKQLLELSETLEPAEMQEGMYLESEYTVSLYGCTEDGLLRSELFDIVQAGQQYYIDDWENIYLVPKEYNELFDAIVETYLENW